MSTKPIGLFDSGVGGTSIWKEIHHLLPYENTIYLADSKNAPYGPKGKDKIKTLRATYDVPFIGIEPAIKPAALQTQTKAVGILATKGTLSSELFSNTSALYSSGIKVIEQDGDGIVQLIETGKLYSEEMKGLLKMYLEPMLKADIDYLVLGCTHYPYLIPLLFEILPEHIKIIDSGEAVARQTKNILEQNNLLNTRKPKPTIKFYSNSNPEVMQSLLGESFKAEFLEF